MYIPTAFLDSASNISACHPPPSTVTVKLQYFNSMALIGQIVFGLHACKIQEVTRNWAWFYAMQYFRKYFKCVERYRGRLCRSSLDSLTTEEVISDVDLLGKSLFSDTHGGTNINQINNGFLEALQSD